MYRNGKRRLFIPNARSPPPRANLNRLTYRMAAQVIRSRHPAQVSLFAGEQGSTWQRYPMTLTLTRGIHAALTIATCAR